jgi:superoxide dismutase, Fe-Mn family
MKRSEITGYSRRSWLVGGLVSSASLLSGCLAEAKPKPPAAASKSPIPPLPKLARALAGTHKIVPLPFKASSLHDLSEKLIQSHHDKNYAGAVKKLNDVESKIAQLPKETPAYVLGGLKQSALTFQNSVTLHEAYFANLGGTGKASSAMQNAIAQSYGDYATWEQHFQACGSSLSGGSGWVILSYDFVHRSLSTDRLANHTQTLSSSYPLLVMDMYEHSYHMDYGPAADRYVKAFFQNIQWDVVEQRLEKAKKAASALL